jgi:kumamolisin
MLNRFCSSASIAVIVLSLTACGSGGSSQSRGPRVSQFSRADPAQMGQKRDLFTALVTGSKDLGPLPTMRKVSVLLLLKDPNGARQAADLKAMYTPHSPLFGKFKTVQQFARSYGPPSRLVKGTQTWLRQRGFVTDWRQGDSWMNVSGSVRIVEKVFGVRVHGYQSPRGVRYYASPRDPVVPVALRGSVAGVGRISNFFQPRTHAAAHAIPAGGLSPNDLLRAYNIKPLRDLGMDGSGETIAFFEVDGFAQKDLDAFTSKFGLPPIHPIIKAGPTLPPGGETEMDLEVAHAIAPQARLLLYNVDWKKATDTSSTYADIGTKFLGPTQEQMINENPHNILSESWGLCDQALGQQITTVWNGMYAKATALGESAFVSTGDEGAYECLNASKAGTPPSPDLISVPLPASLSNVTATGGTRLSVRQDGSWLADTVWEEPGLTGGTGGGFSHYLPMPPWQKGPGVPNQNNPRNLREIPDVSADADPASGVAIFSTGNWQEGGGTSQSAPIWAGMTALFNQYLKSKGLHEAGFLNPALYALFNGKPEFPPFHDVTVGNNLFYPAGAGFDMASGIGTPDGWNLARDLETYLRTGNR